MGGGKKEEKREGVVGILFVSCQTEERTHLGHPLFLVSIMNQLSSS
jgi:hypothetical protein